MPEIVPGRGVRKQRTGFVVRRSMDKTAIVEVERRVRHPIYGKEQRKTSKFYVHDEKNETKVGDKVTIIETRPLSRLKRWRLVAVLDQPGSAAGSAK